MVEDYPPLFVCSSLGYQVLRVDINRGGDAAGCDVVTRLRATTRTAGHAERGDVRDNGGAPPAVLRSLFAWVKGRSRAPEAMGKLIGYARHWGSQTRY